jgi:hypothetical protein
LSTDTSNDRNKDKKEFILIQGPVERCGLVSKGDCLLEIDDVSLTTLDDKARLKLLKSLPDRGPKPILLRFTYAQRQPDSHSLQLAITSSQKTDQNQDQNQSLNSDYNPFPLLQGADIPDSVVAVAAAASAAMDAVKAVSAVGFSQATASAEAAMTGTVRTTLTTSDFKNMTLDASPCCLQLEEDFDFLEDHDSSTEAGDEKGPFNWKDISGEMGTSVSFRNVSSTGNVETRSENTNVHSTNHDVSWDLYPISNSLTPYPIDLGLDEEAALRDHALRNKSCFPSLARTSLMPPTHISSISAQQRNRATMMELQYWHARECRVALGGYYTSKGKYLSPLLSEKGVPKSQRHSTKHEDIERAATLAAQQQEINDKKRNDELLEALLLSSRTKAKSPRRSFSANHIIAPKNANTDGVTSVQGYDADKVHLIPAQLAKHLPAVGDGTTIISFEEPKTKRCNDNIQNEGESDHDNDDEDTDSDGEDNIESESLKVLSWALNKSKFTRHSGRDLPKISTVEVIDIDAHMDSTLANLLQLDRDIRAARGRSSTKAKERERCGQRFVMFASKLHSLLCARSTLFADLTMIPLLRACMEAYCSCVYSAATMKLRGPKETSVIQACKRWAVLDLAAFCFLDKMTTQRIMVNTVRLKGCQRLCMELNDDDRKGDDDEGDVSEQDQDLSDHMDSIHSLSELALSMASGSMSAFSDDESESDDSDESHVDRDRESESESHLEATNMFAYASSLDTWNVQDKKVEKDNVMDEDGPLGAEQWTDQAASTFIHALNALIGPARIAKVRVNRRRSSLHILRSVLNKGAPETASGSGSAIIDYENWREFSVSQPTLRDLDSDDPDFVEFQRINREHTRMLVAAMEKVAKRAGASHSLRHIRLIDREKGK